MKIMLFENKFNSVTPLYKYFNILNIKQTIKHLHGKFMWKLLSQEHPEPILELFPLRCGQAINNNGCKGS